MHKINTSCLFRINRMKEKKINSFTTNFQYWRADETKGGERLKSYTQLLSMRITACREQKPGSQKAVAVKAKHIASFAQQEKTAQSLKYFADFLISSFRTSVYGLHATKAQQEQQKRSLHL